ncbi:hypothetical protein MNBD_NITROSPIRAE03-1163 [hydrothermal vent metagenome]|uniref:DUF4912 domain-containing protein n=1 Tax=hydrothermal vent metagenome TaxID=652676 RepID=A0A3B1DEF4_9ZZZZ
MEQKVGKEAEKSLEGKNLPKGYNIDTIVIMPINADMNFVYWEITDKLLNGRLRELNIGSAELMIRIFERDSRKEVRSFEVKGRVGKNYIKYPASFRPLVAEIGILKNGEFSMLLKSKPALFPSLETSGTGDEVWMEKIKDRGDTVWVSGSEGSRDMASSGISERAALQNYYEEIGAGPGDSASSEILRTKNS